MGKIITSGIMANGNHSSDRFRKQLMSDVCEAWYNVNPRKAKAMMQYIHDVTQVEHKDGYSKGGKVYCKIRLPNDLYICLKSAFRQHLPNEPVFGYCDRDLELLYSVAPKLRPPRTRARRGRN